MASDFRKHKGAVGAILILAFLLIASVFAQDRAQNPNPAVAGRGAGRGAPGVNPANHPRLATGATAPDFNLPGVDGKMHKLSDYASSPILAVLFNCVHCPVAQLYESRIQSLYDDYRQKGVALVAISPNAASAEPLTDMSWSDALDTFEGLMIRAQYRRMTYSFLYDGDTQTVAQAYGPYATPHIFIFDKDRKLQYDGRIDDSIRQSLVKTMDARNALDALLAGKPLEVHRTAAFGCTTKWAEQIQAKEALRKKIDAAPVELEMAGVEDMKKLRANATDNVLLVHFWTTWCRPSVEKLPEMLDTSHAYHDYGRNFDFVTVAMDGPDQKAAVKEVLDRVHSTVRNLQFNSDDTAALAKAFDPDWDGGVPFTLAIAPGGTVFFLQRGLDINVLEQRRAILAHMNDNKYLGHAAYWASKWAAY